MREQHPLRLYLMLSVLLLGMAGVLLRLMYVTGGGEEAAVGVRQGTRHHL